MPNWMKVLDLVGTALDTLYLLIVALIFNFILGFVGAAQFFPLATLGVEMGLGLYVVLLFKNVAKELVPIKL